MKTERRKKKRRKNEKYTRLEHSDGFRGANPKTDLQINIFTSQIAIVLVRNLYNFTLQYTEILASLWYYRCLS